MVENVTFVGPDDELQFLTLWFGPDAPNNSSWSLQPSGPFDTVPVCAMRAATSLLVTLSCASAITVEGLHHLPACLQVASVLGNGQLYFDLVSGSSSIWIFRSFSITSHSLYSAGNVAENNMIPWAGGAQDWS